VDEILNLATTVIIRIGINFGTVATLNHVGMNFYCYVPPEDQNMPLRLDGASDWFAGHRIELPLGLRASQRRGSVVRGAWRVACDASNC
jgi:hypothetical protein